MSAPERDANASNFISKTDESEIPRQINSKHTPNKNKNQNNNRSNKHVERENHSVRLSKPMLKFLKRYTNEMVIVVRFSVVLNTHLALFCRFIPINGII